MSATRRYFSPEQKVADGAADQVCLVIELPQTVENFERVGIDVLARERVLFAPHDPRLDHRPHCTKTFAERT